jgi:hypothetical protein
MYRFVTNDKNHPQADGDGLKNEMSALLAANGQAKPVYLFTEKHRRHWELEV